MPQEHIDIPGCRLRQLTTVYCVPNVSQYSPSLGSVVGIVGVEVANRLEPLAHHYLSADGRRSSANGSGSMPTGADLFEDFLELLPKEGMLGIHVVWPSRSYASARAEWLASAEGAGCVDTLVFRDGGDRVPLGANVTVDSFIDLFAQFAVRPRGTTLVHGAGHTARSLISALHILGVSKVLVYDPRPGRSDAMVANVQASADSTGSSRGSTTSRQPSKSPTDSRTACIRRRVRVWKRRMERFGGGSTDRVDYSEPASHGPPAYFPAGVSAFIERLAAMALAR